MGRYAFFNTGFEYKFWFGVQDSNDISQFGGLGGINENDEYFHKWTTDESDNILRILRDFEKSFDIPALNTEPFEKNMRGTDRMYSLLCGPIFDEYLTNKEQAYYALGWIIYHQLTYESKLNCIYDP